MVMSMFITVRVCIHVNVLVEIVNDTVIKNTHGVQRKPKCEALFLCHATSIMKINLEPHNAMPQAADLLIVTFFKPSSLTAIALSICRGIGGDLCYQEMYTFCMSVDLSDLPITPNI